MNTNFIVLLFSITVFLFIVGAFFVLSPGIIEKDKRIQALKHKNDYINEEYKSSLFDRTLKPVWIKLIKIINKLNVNKNSSKKTDDKLQKNLEMAGLDMSVGTFNMLRLFMVIVSMPIFMAICKIVKQPIFFGMIASLYVYVGAIFVLKKIIENKKSKIQRDLPEVMDLLAVSVEAGLGLDSAIMRLSTQKKSLLVDEFVKVIKDVQMGRPRRIALKEFGERYEIQELRVLATAFIQSEQLGVSIKNVLIAQGNIIRKARKQRAEEAAMKAPIKIMIPMVIFIFPVLFIILLGPAALNYMKGF